MSAGIAARLAGSGLAEFHRLLAASAAVLQKFFQMKDRSAASVETIVQGLQLVSDLKLREQAEALKSRIQSAADAQVQAALKTELEAVLKNIHNETLRPA